MLTLVSSGDLQIVTGCLLGLLDESVQQDHPAFVIDVEKHSGDSVLRQIGSDFIDPLTERPADRHSDGPPEFNDFDVYSDALPVLLR